MCFYLELRRNHDQEAKRIRPGRLGTCRGFLVLALFKERNLDLVFCLEVGEIKKDRLKRKLFYAAITGMGYVIIYGICQQYFDIGQQYYMYTPSWTLRNVLWFAALISVTPSLFGHYCFSIITLTGYILGVIAGEMFGGFKSHIPPEYLHYGWVIWGSVYILSSIIGILVEVLIRQRHKTVT